MNNSSRSVSIIDYVKLFAGTRPSFFTWIFFGMMATAFHLGFFEATGIEKPEGIWLIAAVPLVVGLVQLVRKVLKYEVHLTVLKYGSVAYCELTGIRQTNMTVNDRAVLEFEFTYTINEVKYKHYLKSSKQYGRSTGETFVIFYLPENPNKAFLPELNGLRSISADIDGPKNY